ncbi:hypothetical protein J3458_001631 [Metarhizium acridum]|uniref:uncharacterized protein n=1 Tax=Metarhizium acridum TaxID=92637 RepID=UPI001C6B6CA3|nr:hypothetical protein J3458_001631 [Metarhizium acridum]
MAGYSAVLRGDSRVFVVDRVPERLQVAEAIGCIPVDLTKSDAVEQIIEVNNGMVDRSVDAVGYQAMDSRGSSEQPNIVLENMIRVTRPCGGLGIPGLYVPSDPGAPDTAAAKGMISLSFGKLFEKGLKLATGQCSVKAYNRYLRDLIIAGKAKPSFVVSHEITLDDVEVTYDRFDKRLEGYTKVLIHPMEDSSFIPLPRPIQLVPTTVFMIAEAIVLQVPDTQIGQHRLLNIWTGSLLLPSPSANF